MAPIIVAYDGTPQANDALALARLLSDELGAPLALAHMYRADPRDRPPSGTVLGRETFVRRQAERLLAQAPEPVGPGAESRSPGASGMSRHALAGTTTASALRRFAEQQNAALLVFGSARNGPTGHVHPGSAARRLLQSVGCPVAFAPEGFRERAPRRPTGIAVAHDDEQASARRTAEALAKLTGGAVHDLEDRASPGGEAAEAARADLIVVGSRAGAPVGKVRTSAAAERLIQAARAPVIVLPRGVALDERALRDGDAGRRSGKQASAA
jgi:nucleotide-binding universal stress UspA family protein